VNVQTLFAVNAKRLVISALVVAILIAPIVIPTDAVRHGCNQFNCATCDGLVQCNFCEYTVCVDCTTQVAHCGCLLCKGCFSFGLCNKCDSQVCRNCEDILECPGCNTRFCDKKRCWEQVQECMECNTWFCNRAMDYCSQCDTNFCKNHNHMVDCKSCEAFHCRHCWNKNMKCDLCGVVCYLGECGCDNDGNEKEPAAKRAKSS
jgi:hypothetical protein